MSVFETTRVCFGRQCYIDWPISFFGEAKPNFDTRGIEIRFAVVWIIDRSSSVNHQMIGDSVLELDVVPCEISSRPSAIVKPVFRFDHMPFKSLKNQCFVDVILAVCQPHSRRQQAETYHKQLHRSRAATIHRLSRNNPAMASVTPTILCHEGGSRKKTIPAMAIIAAPPAKIAGTEESGSPF